MVNGVPPCPNAGRDENPRNRLCHSCRHPYGPGPHSSKRLSCSDTKTITSNAQVKLDAVKMDIPLEYGPRLIGAGDLSAPCFMMGLRHRDSRRQSDSRLRSIWENVCELRVLTLDLPLPGFEQNHDAPASHKWFLQSSHGLCSVHTIRRLCRLHP